ncbi:CPBP family intramembrane glutamic endopeptidase [Catellatospora citrea]|uniref:CAAX prenyl protease 2/Lysostaphin resistance protein A-like domain-containing protein n=1 Tax=Catellatospora citrea TaxID=53366 RepID=A0A8J3KQM6_9ACTN|nr:CPBP family intramembrane glutamic endopeptidase [Catellatospora citrea]RKE02816.1 CAAX prenyl protease-like protein [Catellatospora citrea]GIG01629.1 hypothetical protein Cci01nite_67220 [Catellatospora citrea]
MASTVDDTRRQARRGLTVFLILVAVFAAIFQSILAATTNPWWVYAVMWSVAAASVVARLVLNEGFADVSFRFGPARRTLPWIAFGVAFPLVVGAVAYGAAWLTGLARFTAPAAFGGFGGRLLLAATIGAVISALSAAGEEIGWRGYMLTRLIQAGVPRPVFVSGLIWGLWHVPLIATGFIYGGHPYTWLAVLVFLVSAIATGYVIARTRLETGSIWPPITLHAAYNSVIQAAFDPATSGPNAALWVGEEAGLLVAATLVVAAVICSRGTWRLLATPDRPLAVPPGIRL